MLPFLISACRAIVEMLGLCLLAQGMLYLIAGARRQDNPIYRLFEFLTRAPRIAVARLFGWPPGAGRVGGVTFILLFVLWIGLAIFRNAI